MDKYVVNGGRPLIGEVTISGAKNAAVAILPATILAEGPCIIENIPNISDVSIIIRILYEMGAKVRRINKTTVEIDTTHITSPIVSYEMAKHMRASYYFIGALLGRYNYAKVSMPGGCDFGVRPIDQHVKGFETLGATVSTEYGMIEAQAEMLVGNQVFFDVVSVGAVSYTHLDVYKRQLLAEGEGMLLPLFIL